MAGWDKKRSFRLKSTLLDAARGENIGFNDVFLHIWKGSSPELWTSDIEWTTFYVLISGGEVNYERAAITVLDEFRSGTLGRLTLELPEA